MRIVYIITGTDVGGAEMALLKLLGRLSPEFEPHVISMVPLGPVGRAMQELGVAVESLGMQRGRAGWRAFATLVRRLRVLQPDAVHTWMYHADLMGGLAARIACRAPVAWCVRNSDLDGQRALTRIVRACAALSRWVPRRIVCCSTVARDIHVRLGYRADRFVVIPNGFDLARFLPDSDARARIRRELRLPEQALVVGAVGRWHPQKDHVGLLRACANAMKRDERIHCVAVGEGVDVSNPVLAQEVKRLGLAPRVHLLGPRSDIPAVMAAFDVFVSASAFGEAFPNVVGEAMATGVPCVVTDVGDSRAIVGDTGVVVPPRDPSSLGKAIGDLLALDPGERSRRGLAARVRVAQVFDLGRVTEAYEAFYRQLAPGVPAPLVVGGD
ncbi:MAG: glycosyltransferase [Burkholderiales bacterium]